MRVIEPVTMPYSSLTSSNVPEADAPAWVSTTAYAVGAVVMQDHKIYEAIAANTNKPPALDVLNDNWIFLRATNRWKMMDGTLSQGTVYPDQIRYEFTMPTTSDSIAVFGLNAGSMQITIRDGVTNADVYNMTTQLISTEGVYDGYTYAYSPIDNKSQVIVTGLPLYANNKVIIRFYGATSVTVGELIFGTDRLIGDALTGTSVGIRDYSLKQRDDFGGYNIVQRGFSRVVNFSYMCPTSEVPRLQQMFARLRSKMAVYYSGTGRDKFATTVPGFYNDFNIPLTTNVSFGTLEVESLI